MPCGFVRRERGRTIKNDSGRRPAKVVRHSGDVGRPPAGTIGHSGDVVRPPARAIEHFGYVGRPPARAIGHFGDVVRPPAGTIGHSGDVVRPPARAIEHFGYVGRPPARAIGHFGDVVRPPAGEFLTIKPACFQRSSFLSSVFHQSMAPRVPSPTFAAKRNSKRGPSHWLASIQLRNLILIETPCKSSL